MFGKTQISSWRLPWTRCLTPGLNLSLITHLFYWNWIYRTHGKKTQNSRRDLNRRPSVIWNVGLWLQLHRAVILKHIWDAPTNHPSKQTWGYIYEVELHPLETRKKSASLEEWKHKVTGCAKKTRKCALDYISRFKTTFIRFHKI